MSIFQLGSESVPVPVSDPAGFIGAEMDGYVEDRRNSGQGSSSSSGGGTVVQGGQSKATDALLQKSLFWRTFQRKESHDAYIEVDKLREVEQDGKIHTIPTTEAWREYRFIVESISMPKKEKISIIKTFGEDSDFLLTFGRDSMIWRISGMLRNERGAHGDWVSAFDQLYQNRLRASVLARHQKIMRLAMGELDIEGYMLDLNLKRQSNMDDAAVPFSFKMLVKGYSGVSRENRMPDAAALSQLDPGASTEYDFGSLLSQGAPQPQNDPQQ